MASILGIAPGDLKVVQVFEGSAIIQLIINAEEDDEDPMTTLRTIEDTFVENAESFTAELGAPVMQVLTDEGTIEPMTGYEDYSDLAKNELFMAMFEAIQEKNGCTRDQQRQYKKDNRKAEKAL